MNGFLRSKRRMRHCFLAYMQRTLWEMGLDEAQSGIKVARRNVNNLRYADDTILMAESEEELRAS